MRSMWWQLGILGTISVFVYRHRETKCVNLKILITSFRAHDMFQIISRSLPSF